MTSLQWLVICYRLAWGRLDEPAQADALRLLIAEAARLLAELGQRPAVGEGDVPPKAAGRVSREGHSLGRAPPCGQRQEEMQ